MARSRPSFIVGIGGSAGALDGYKALLDALPSFTGMAFVIISHMTHSASHELAELLSTHTEMPVAVALNAMPIKRNRVYVIPSDADLFIEKNSFKVVSPRTRKNVQIDLFFTSLAEAMGAHAIGILLSGYDGDGTEGCRQIKAVGGATFAQDSSAEVNDMPLSAQRAGVIDLVLPPDKIASALKGWMGAAAA
jgi:chemotaxis response regulator CheB